MKALIVILTCVALALVFKAVEFISSRKINSVGAKSSKTSANMPRVNITDEKELKDALNYYKELAD